MIRQVPKILMKINLSGFLMLQYYSLYHQGQSLIKQTSVPLSNLSSNISTITMQAQYKKISQQGLRHAELTRKIRSACSIYEVRKVLVENFDQFQLLGKTLIFDYLNLTFLQIRGSKQKTLLQDLVITLERLQNLSLYQLTMKLSLYQKLRVFLSNTSSKVQFFQDLYKCVDQILAKLQQQQSDIGIYDFINILAAFRIQSHPKLLNRSLQILNKEIFKPDINDLKYKKLWVILLSQFKYFTWNDMKKFHNIIIFWTDQFNLAEINWTYMEACELFQKLAQLKLHKIGQKKIPSAIKQCMWIISKNVNKLSHRDLIATLKATNLLPAEFVSDFRDVLMKKFIEKGQFFTNGILFPFIAMNQNQFQQIFTNKFTQIEQVWRSMAYYSQLQQLNTIMRGNLKEQIGKILDKIQSNKNQRGGINQIYSVDSATNLVRVGHLALYYASKKDEQRLKQLGNIIISGFNKIGFKKATKEVSFIIFFDMFLIFHDNPIIHDLFKEFCTTLNLRKQKSKYDNFMKNCWKNIKNFIEFDNEYIQKGIMVMIDELYSARKIQLSSEPNLSKQNEDAFDWTTDVYFLYYIMNRKEQPNAILKQLKMKIISKIKTFQELETIVQYFLLESNLNFRGSLQLINLIFKLSDLKSINEKGKKNRVLFMFLNLIQSSNSLVNKRGKLQSNLVNYLNNFDGKIYDQIACFQYLNQLNRALNSIKQFGEVKKFVLKIYKETLIQIHEKIQKQQNLKKSSRLIVQFLFKIQSVTDSTSIQLSQSRVILEKIYAILNKLIKIDDGIYIKARFLEFITMYQEFINVKENISEALAIELEYQLGRCGQNTNSLKQTYFTLCKLECMGLHESSSVVEYSSILLQLVKRQKVTSFSINNFILSILYSIQLLNLQENKIVIQKFNKYLTPMIQRSISICTGLNNSFIIFNCIKYFIFVKNEQKVQFLTFYLLKLHLSPKMLINLLQTLNWKTISKPLFEAILNKTLNAMYLFDANSINLLYMFERVYFNTPAQYSMFQQKFWLTANEQMDKNINNLKQKKQKLTFQEKRKMLGPFLIYIYCCIKAEKVEGNKNLEFLLPFVAENSLKIYSGDISKQYSLSKYIILYAQNVSKSTGKNKLFKSGTSSVKIDLDNAEKSKQLEIFLAQNSVLFSKNEKINNIRVPYYLPHQKQVIILNSNNYNKDQLMKRELKIYGHMKFQYEVYKALLPGYKVRIFDPCTSTLI